MIYDDIVWHPQSIIKQAQIYAYVQYPNDLFGIFTGCLWDSNGTTKQRPRWGHDAGISKKAIKLKPVAVVKGWGAASFR